MAEPHPNPTPIEIGMKAKLQGRQYQVVGRLVVSMMEDGDRYYWNEFQLVAADGSVAYLDYDENRWRLLVPMTVARPMTPADMARLRTGSRVTIDGKAANVTEAATARVHHVEGMHTWDVKAGDESYYVDAKGGTGDYCIESYGDGRSIEYLRGQHLSRREVYAAFGLADALQRLRGSEQALEHMLRVGAIACVLAVLALLIWAFTGTTGRVLARGSVDLRPTPQPTDRVGPFRLEPGDNVHRITVARSGGTRVSGKVERGAPAGVERPDPVQPPTALPLPMPRGAASARKDFKVTEPGDYYVQLSGDAGMVEYEIRGDVFHRPAVLGYALSAGLGGGGLLTFAGRAKSNRRA